MNMTLKTLSTSLLFFGILMNSDLSSAQDCSDYFPFDQGTKYEISHYDKKNKLQSTDNYEVVANSGNQATVHTVMRNAKGEETINAKYDMVCDADKVSIDFNKLMSEKMTSEMAGKDIDVDIDGTMMVIPNNLKVGQTLPDNILNLKVSSSAMNMNFKIKVYNRKVVGEEKITIPAGTFDCMVIEHDSEINMLITKHTKSKQWIAKGAGIVKQETYSKKGKLESKQEMTSFSK
ncbi:hypothetical protein Q4566_14135 [Tamlana sp. 2_MG-2023]|uniref:TapB family protein n=1 Tax=unclassified Tamlana TaxID=2614803 RepID=UPI0026E2FC98|nr:MULTISPECIES: hypothetical protein [unclassified Tamlana]MDO6761347.1 hypothetical protein [Tamlana sp. 2_MG-2023]MDO6792039.1 hypothetical protein [Tamlana sp. 1_MG-2023]